MSSLYKHQLQTAIECQHELSAKARERLQWLVFYCEHHQSARETCRHFSLKPVTLYRLLRRFDPANPRTLEDLSRRPHTLRGSKKSAVIPATAPVATPIAIEQQPVPVALVPAAIPEPATCDGCLVCRARNMQWTRAMRRTAFVGSVLVNIALIGSLLLSAVMEKGNVSADITGSSSESCLP